MKKQVIAFIIALGGTAAYAGNTEKWTRTSGKDEDPEYSIARNKSTLFITDPAKQYAEETGKQSIEKCVLNKFGFNLPFRLQTN